MPAINAEQLKAIAGGKPVAANLKSVVVALDKFGPGAGLDKPHRLAHFLAQLAHESGGFRYDREIWGPTPAQKKYESGSAKARELGNTVRGDGKKFSGRGPIQLTGRGNVVKFKTWCDGQGFDAPDFVADPEQINTDPWEGLSAIWFWDKGNQIGKSLNVYADQNNIIQITKMINGGLNGFEDRASFYTRAGLVLLGYAPNDVRAFQAKAKLVVDGDAGPLTWAAMHMELARNAAISVTAAPVTNDVVVDIKAPNKGLADTATGAGVSSAGLGTVLQGLQESLTPFSMAGDWIGRLVVILIVVGAVLTIGGLAYRFWASRQRAKIIAELNVPVAS